jgi:inosose dehydratase
MDRREFSRTIGLGVGAACFSAPLAEGAPKRRLKVGYTSITWGFRPEHAEPGIRDSARLGYHGYESLGESIEAWEAKGGIGRLCEEHNIPLVSTYFGVNLSDPAKRREQIEKVIRWGKILKKYGGSVAVMGPNGVKRDTFDFKTSKADIVTTLNEIGRVLNDLGLATTVHQHTETCIMTRDEVYAVMEAVDTKYVKFGPDVAQLAASGSDPVKILKDFQPIIRSVHLKDFLGGPHWSGYCPLGQGKVDIPAVVELLEGAKQLEYLMVELDASPNPPLPPFECAKVSKEYLQKLGYQFRA